jgi:hypothetical protein
MTETVAKIIIPIVAVAVSGALAFFTARTMARVQTRRQQRLDYLVGAYRSLVDCAHRQEWTPERATAFEKAMADVFLFGNVDHIAAAKEVREGMATVGEASLDGLLIALRAGLRRELGLSPDHSGGVPVIRISAGSDSVRPPASQRRRQG